MRINFKDGKNVELKIPLFHKKYNDEKIKELYKMGLFSDVDTILEKFEEIEKTEDDTDKTTYYKKIKKIGIWVSGGADSSILLYCLSKMIKDENLNFQIQPLSVRRGRPWNPIYAANVIDWIVDELNFENMLPHIVYYPDKNDEYQRENKEFRERDVENFNNGIVDVMYSGITMNPPADDKTISKNKERSRDETSERLIVNDSLMCLYINPFFNINKKHIAEIYNQFNLIDTLFPLTRSCEGFAQDTGYYTYHCGKCWWCEERMWAFGRL